MANRDFFGFCTSLKPLELRAVGALSRVRHIAADETIYRAGDVADTLFILNRGVVEVVQEGAAHGAGSTYLSRGDIFGDVEVLTDLPRKHSVRTCEPVSVQCFARENFAELVQRVPSFFRYLSEQLAGRLLQARDVALSRSHCLELSGSLANFDLVTVYQTIMNSSQTGELAIRDAAGETVAAFQFEAGRVRGGQFQHLIGEEAFRQLFLATELHGTFSFSSGENPESSSAVKRTFTRDTGEILIAALQARDELDALRNQLPESTTRLLRQKMELQMGEIPAELQSSAEKIWTLASGGRLRLCDIFEKLDVCELTIYRAVSELMKTGQLELAPTATARRVA